MDLKLFFDLPLLWLTNSSKHSGCITLMEIRQITITGNGKIEPTIIITNDTDLPVEQIIKG